MPFADINHAGFESKDALLLVACDLDLTLHVKI